TWQRGPRSRIDRREHAALSREKASVVTARSGVMAGAVAGLAAGLTFAAAHAFIIEPIWSRMFGGLVFGIIAGAASGWAYAELLPPSDSGRLRSGWPVGCMLWPSASAATLADV